MNLLSSAYISSKHITQFSRLVVLLESYLCIKSYYHISRLFLWSCDTLPPATFAPLLNPASYRRKTRRDWLLWMSEWRQFLHSDRGEVLAACEWIQGCRVRKAANLIHKTALLLGYNWRVLESHFTWRSMLQDMARKDYEAEKGKYLQILQQQVGPWGLTPYKMLKNVK